MNNRSFLRKMMDSSLLDKIRTDIIDGAYVALEGRRDKMKHRLTVARGLNMVEIIFVILDYLEYHDLRNIYNVCTGFRQMVDSSHVLRSRLFLAPDYDCQPHWIPLKAFASEPGHLELDHFKFTTFKFDKKSLERLRRQPRLAILSRLATQPPTKYMQLYIRVEKDIQYISGRTGDVEVRNESGITLEDFVDSVYDWDEAAKSTMGSKWVTRGSLYRYELVASPS